MRISPGSVEYVHVPLTGVPFDAENIEICFDPPGVPVLEQTWNPAAFNDTKTRASVLVGGPDAPGSGYVILPRGDWPVAVRLADHPEVVVRNTNHVIEVRD